MPKELAKQYAPQGTEDRIYQNWCDKGYFHTQIDRSKKPFTIVMPPPNVTGQLHMGHAMDETWQDILTRYKRMQGYAALWVPGTDHASIATEAKVVAKMREEGLTKEMVGRDGFLERAWDWKNTYGNRIVSQLKKLGCSCDWQRERFTMDEGCSNAVKEVFVRLYDKGLIYRGNRMVNWCPHCNTSISDAEVEYEAKEGSFWHLRYKVKETEPLTHDVGTCYRCHSVIEPMVSKQWFVKMEPLAKPAIESVEKGEIKFVPERFTKNYINWMKGGRDWCISRQLWWGHQIPAWYCDDCGETVVAKEAPSVCPKCGCTHLTQDPDTLDTWFSSALWPFSTLGWPDENAEDYNYFYPTNTLVTGYDIIGFWVSRMIFSGLAYTGKAPFDTVLIHGIVRDSQGRKMSKSLGNGIDPLEVIDQYGADALRLMLIIGSTAGNDMRYSDEKVLAARNFANKLWNASRFVQMNLPEDFQPGLPAEEQLDMSDKWVLSELAKMAADATANLDKYELGLAAEKVENFIWEVYCDWYIEICKTRLNGDDAQAADTARKVLVYVLDRALKLLHPFMPFITEEIYQALPGSGETIMTQLWPGNENMKIWAEDCADFEKLMDYIKAVRTMRAEMNVHPAKKTSMVIETASPAAFEKGGAYLARFAFATDVTVTPKYEGSADGMVNVATPDAKGFIPMMELIDREKELARLNKELTKAEKELGMFTNQLNNPKFVEKAPAKLVEETRAKLAAAQEKTAKIKESIAALG